MRAATQALHEILKNWSGGRQQRGEGYEAARHAAMALAQIARSSQAGQEAVVEAGVAVTVADAVSRFMEEGPCPEDLLGQQLHRPFALVQDCFLCLASTLAAPNEGAAVAPWRPPEPLLAADTLEALLTLAEEGPTILVRERDAALPYASAAGLPTADAVACGGAAPGRAAAAAGRERREPRHRQPSARLSFCCTPLYL